MKILIVVTTPKNELWGMAQEENWQKDDVLQEIEVRATNLDSDNRIVVICQASLSDEIYDDSGITEKTTEWVTEIANHPKYATDARLHIAAHSDYVDFKSLRENVDNARLIACASFSHLPEAPGLDELSDALYRLLPKPSLGEFEETLSAVKNKQQLTHAQRLSTLKHRLAHLFLPVSVDLQAWCSYGFDDEYMREILKSYDDEDERLKRARGLLYGEGQPEEADNVKKIVEEYGLEDDESWEKVALLLPRSKEEKSASADYSEVFQHLDVLGSLKDKDKLKQLRESLQTGRNPFNDWYAKLDAALVELRKKMHRAS